MANWRLAFLCLWRSSGFSCTYRHSSFLWPPLINFYNLLDLIRQHMDPPTATMMNENHTVLNTTPFNLSEIWPMEISRGSFGPGLGLFVEPGPAREVSGTGAEGRKRRENSALDDDDSAKGVCNGMSDSDGKRLKTLGSGDDNRKVKADVEASSGKEAEQKTKPQAEPPKDYIHVRARRGQATDSHSLAERARREKISERMRILQDLVPGCNKVIGKALVLDEIINYIQSLQRQVEFLSMKLEAVNSGLTPGIEAFPVKDFGQQAFDTSGVVYGAQTTPREYGRDTSPEWLHMQIGGGGFDRQP